MLVAMGAGLLAWLPLLGAGLTIAKKWPVALCLGSLVACAGVPVVLMHHVSELYAYNMAQFLAVIVALALPVLLEPRCPRRCAHHNGGALARRAAQRRSRSES